MEAARTSETSVVKYFTRQYNPEDNSELHIRRRKNLKSYISLFQFFYNWNNFINSTSLTGLSFRAKVEYLCQQRYNDKLKWRLWVKSFLTSYIIIT
jgi:hypothetical protein